MSLTNEDKDYMAEIIVSALKPLDEKLDNLGKQISDVEVEVGAINTRLGQMETTINRTAAKVGVPGLPASDSAGRTSTLPLAADSAS